MGILKAKLEAQNFTGLTKDDILGDLLYTTALKRSYPESESIPAELSPSPIDNVYFYQAVFFNELSTFKTSIIETTGQPGVVAK